MRYTEEQVAAMRIVAKLIMAERASNRAITWSPTSVPTELLEQCERKSTGPGAQDLMELWNSKADDRLPRCKLLTAGRRRAAAARLKEFPEQHTWAAFIEYINTAAWTLGEVKNDKHPSWKANFDFLVKPGSMVKFLEGQYTTQQPESARERYGAELEKRSETRGGE